MSMKEDSYVYSLSTIILIVIFQIYPGKPCYAFDLSFLSIWNLCIFSSQSITSHDNFAN